MEVTCSAISALLTDETCDPVFSWRMTYLRVPAQRWLAYRAADSELAGQYVSLSLTLHESIDVIIIIIIIIITKTYI